MRKTRYFVALSFVLLCAFVSSCSSLPPKPNLPEPIEKLVLKIIKNPPYFQLGDVQIIPPPKDCEPHIEKDHCVFRNAKISLKTVYTGSAVKLAAKLLPVHEYLLDLMLDAVGTSTPLSAIGDVRIIQSVITREDGTAYTFRSIIYCKDGMPSFEGDQKKCLQVYNGIKADSSRSAQILTTEGAAKKTLDEYADDEVVPAVVAVFIGKEQASARNISCKEATPRKANMAGC